MCVVWAPPFDAPTKTKRQVKSTVGAVTATKTSRTKKKKERAGGATASKGIKREFDSLLTGYDDGDDSGDVDVDSTRDDSEAPPALPRQFMATATCLRKTPLDGARFTTMLPWRADTPTQSTPPDVAHADTLSVSDTLDVDLGGAVPHSKRPDVTRSDTPALSESPDMVRARSEPP
jgi:hypothetical protein